jgi:endonuclease-3
MDGKEISEEVAGRLVRFYGHRKRGRDDPVDSLIRTVLSQNTTDVNSHRAFEELKGRFPTLAELAYADLEEIEDSIRIGGLFRKKAIIIRDLARRFVDEDIVLEDLDDAAARSYLKSIEGVGSKTASCVLLFALGRDVLPVDTHVFRLTRRIGLLDEGVPIDRADEELEKIVTPGLRHDLHLNLIQHGRRVCRPRNPRCGECLLLDLCRYGREATSGQSTH